MSAQAGALSVTPAALISGELVRVTGRLSTASKRRVRLQVASPKASKKWKTVRKASTTRAGDFKFRLRAGPRTFKVRVLSPKTKKFKQSTTRTRLVTVYAQKISLKTPHESTFSNRPVIYTAKARPIRAGRAFILQKNVEGRWTRVAKLLQDNTGRARFTVRPDRPGRLSYRVITASDKGASAVISRPAVAGLEVAGQPGRLNLEDPLQ